MKKTVKFLLALVLLGACAVIVYGVVTGNDLLGSVRGWWTLFLIIPGLMGLFYRGARLSSFGLMLFGGIMLLSENAESWLAAWPDTAQRVGSISWLLAAGVVTLFISALSILGSLLGIKRRHHVSVTTDGEVKFSSGSGSKRQRSVGGKEHSAVFSEQHISFAGQSFTGTEFDAIFSNLSADLTEAVIEGDCTIDANAIFGTVTVKTGLNANYRVNANRVFGAVSSVERKEVVGLPTVTIEGNCVFGNIEII